MVYLAELAEYHIPLVLQPGPQQRTDYHDYRLIPDNDTN